MNRRAEPAPAAPVPRDTLDARLLHAHATGDQTALVALYEEAGRRANNPVAAGFYLTHAYIYALELGHPAAAALHARLKAEGREE